MIRETQEEAGLKVIPETIKEYGYVHRIQKSDDDPSECFVQDNYYYLCDAVDGLVSQNLDDYEKKESYQLEYIEPAFAAGCQHHRCQYRSHHDQNDSFH